MTNSCIVVASLFLRYRHGCDVRLMFQSRDVVFYFLADFLSLSDVLRSVPEQFLESTLRKRSMAAGYCGSEVLEHS